MYRFYYLYINSFDTKKLNKRVNFLNLQKYQVINNIIYIAIFILNLKY